VKFALFICKGLQHRSVIQCNGGLSKECCMNLLCGLTSLDHERSLTHMS
jgi:hypothetical protein